MKTGLTGLVTPPLPQLKVVDGILCVEYTPSPTSKAVTVPFLPPSPYRLALTRCHIAPSAGHFGPDRTLERLRQEAYWIGKSRDVEQHFQEYSMLEGKVSKATAIAT